MDFSIREFNFNRRNCKFWKLEELFSFWWLDKYPWFLSLISFLIFLLIQGESLSLKIIVSREMQLETTFLMVLLNKYTFSLASLFEKRLSHGKLTYYFSDILNVCLLIMPNFPVIWRWIKNFRFEFYISYLKIAIFV